MSNDFDDPVSAATDPSDLETKPFLAHLEDLRWMIIKSIAALFLGVISCAFGARWILAMLYVPFKQAGRDPGTLLTLSPTDPITIHLEISLLGGLILSLPFILYFVGQFILPALTQQERYLVLPVFSIGAVLFVLGVVFCYTLVLRVTLMFLLGYSVWLGFAPQWTAAFFVDLEVNMLLAFGLAFEFPLILILLNILGLLSVEQMASKRRHAAVIIFVLACCIMPTTDPFALSLFSLPMYLLFEACLWICWILEKRRAARQED